MYMGVYARDGVYLLVGRNEKHDTHAATIGEFGSLSSQQCTTARLPLCKPDGEYDSMD